MELVVAENLEAQFGEHLEKNEDNELNITNMPWLDIGDLPLSYDPTKSEAFQAYISPPDNYPTQIILEYSQHKHNFCQQFWAVLKFVCCCLMCFSEPQQ